jgi:hypothetical protein
MAAAPDFCEDGLCSYGICEPSPGSCTYELLDDGTPCVASMDGNGCWTDGICNDIGQCLQYFDDILCDDKDDCTLDACVDEGDNNYHCVNEPIIDETCAGLCLENEDCNATPPGRTACCWFGPGGNQYGECQRYESLEGMIRDGLCGL